MRISDYDRVLSPSEGDLFVIETLDGTKTIAYEDMGFVSKSSTETISGIKTFSGTVNLDNPLSIPSGGTGASTAALARTALGIGAAGTLGTPIPIDRGGTGATTAALVRNGLGLGNTTGALPIANGGTAGTTAALARTNLGIGAAGTLGTPIPVNRGGTNGTTAALARTNLGLGTAATCSTTSSVTSGSGSLLTSGGAYSGILTKSWAIGTAVTLTNQTSSNYTFSNHGLLELRASPGNVIGGALNGKNCQVVSPSGSSYSTFIQLFVLKGMTWKTTVKTDSNCTVIFYPFK